MTSIRLLFLSCAAVILVLGGCSSYASDNKMAAKPTADIVDTAASAGQFKTLVAAIEAADLVPVLKSKGPFTVFAPTDAAFAKLPKGTLKSLLKPENKAQLAAILKYHVVPGKVLAKDVAGTRTSAPTANGRKLRVDGTKGVRVDGANVVKADVMASNGVIHVIDKVLLPK